MTILAILVDADLHNLVYVFNGPELQLFKTPS